MFSDAADVKIEFEEEMGGEEKKSGAAGANGELGGTPEEIAARKLKEYLNKVDEKVDFLASERGMMEFYRSSFITVERILINQLAVKKWARPSVSALLKEIFFSKEYFFNKNQVAQLEELMTEFNEGSGKTLSRSIELIRKRAES